MTERHTTLPHRPSPPAALVAGMAVVVMTAVLANPWFRQYTPPTPPPMTPAGIYAEAAAPKTDLGWYDPSAIVYDGNRLAALDRLRQYETQARGGIISCGISSRTVRTPGGDVTVTLALHEHKLGRRHHWKHLLRFVETRAAGERPKGDWDGPRGSEAHAAWEQDVGLAARMLGQAKVREALPALTKLLTDPSAGVRWSATDALEPFGPAAAGAIPILVSRLAGRAEHDAEVGTLAAIGAPALPAITDALGRPETRLGALHVLGRMGPAAAPALPGLVAVADEALDDGNQEVHGAAIGAIGAIGPGAATAIPTLLRHCDARADRSRLFGALAGIGPQGWSALLSRADAADADERGHAVFCLAMGADGRARLTVIPLVTKYLTDPDPTVRFNALCGLEALGGVEHSIRAVAARLFDEDAEVRGTAAQLVFNCQRGAWRAVGPLAVASFSEDRKVRASARDLLRRSFRALLEKPH